MAKLAQVQPTTQHVSPDQLIGHQAGGVSILIIIFVFMAFCLTYGIVAVAETQANKKEVGYGVQSSANAAAFSYGYTLVQELNTCVKNTLEDKLDDPDSESEEESSETCDPVEIQKCLDTDFDECSIDLESCLSDDLIAACEQDPEVKKKAMESAQSAAETVAKKYQLEHLQVSLTDKKVTTKADKQIESQIPTFGLSGKVSAEANSSYSISKKGDDE